MYLPIWQVRGNAVYEDDIMKKLLSLVLAAIMMSQSAVMAADTTEYKYTDFLKDEVAELATLIETCEEKGIVPEYELASYNILKWYTDSNFMLKDEEKMLECEGNSSVLCGKSCTSEKCELRDILTYNENALKEMYNNTKSALTAYNNGTRVETAGNQYDFTEISVDSDGILRDKNGKAVFSVGYASTLSTSWDLETVSAMGSTNAVISKAPSMIYTKNVAKNWVTQGSGSVSYTSEALDGKTVIKVASANNSSSFSVKQTAEVTPGATYTFSVTAKGSNVGLSKLNVYDGESYVWRYGKDIATNTFGNDWKTVSVAFTPSEKILDFDFALLGSADELYISEISVVKSGSTENILKNADFAEAATSNINTYWFRSVQSSLKQAKAAGTTVSLIIDPHYFPTLDGYENDTSLYAKDENGNWKTGEFIKFNINHPKAKEVIGDYLNTIGQILKDDPNSSALSNIVLTNESAFNVANFSDFYMDDFREYLEEKYNRSISSLNEKWGTSFSDFSEINYIRAWCNWDAPGEYDTIQFNEDVFTEWHKWMADILKGYLPKVKISTKVMSYLDRENNPYWQLGKGTDIEKFNTFSDFAGNDAYTFSSYSEPVDMDSFTSKMMWYDFLHSITGKPVYNSEDHIIAEGDNRYSDSIRAVVKADLWQGAVHGRAMSSIWNFSTHDYNGVYDSDSTNNYLMTTRPDVMEEVAHTGLNLRKYSDVLELFNKKPADVAILYSESSRMHVNTDGTETNNGDNPGTKHLKQIFEAYKGAIFAGAKVGFVTEDSQEKMNQCGVLVVPSAEHITDGAMECIKAFMQNGGKVILANDCFKFDEYHNQRTNTLTGETHINAENAADYRTAVSNALTSIRDVNIRIADADTGNDVENIEWQYVIKNGGIYVNVMNYNTDAKNIKISYNNVPVTVGSEIVSNSTVGEVITANSFEPMLFRLVIPQMPEIELRDLKVNSSGVITWSTTDDQYYPGASVYKVTKNGLTFVTTVMDTEYQGVLGETYEIRLLGKDNGQQITAGNVGTFTITLSPESPIFGSYQTLLVNNTISDAAHAVVTMTEKDADGNMIKINSVEFTAAGNEDRKITFYVSNKAASVEFATYNNSIYERLVSKAIMYEND